MKPAWAARSLALIAPLALSACATAFGGAEHKKVGQVDALVQPANVRSAYVIGGKVCPEPQPDEGYQPNLASSAKVTTPSGPGGEGSLNYQATVVPLAGRNSNVLFGRDSGALLCWLAMDGFIQPNEVGPAYLKYLDAAVNFAKADQAAAEATKAVAQAEVVKIAAAVKAPIDPVIVAQAQAINKTYSTAADAVAARFTSSDGKFLPDELKKFSNLDTVKAVLTPSGAVRLGQISTKDDLTFLLTHSFQDSAEALAALAKKFGG